MRRAFVVAVLVLVPCAAWLLWPPADPRFEIRFDAEKTARAARAGGGDREAAERRAERCR